VIIQSLIENPGESEVFLYDGTVEDLAIRLERMVSIQNYHREHPTDSVDGPRAIASFAIDKEQLAQYYWPHRAKEMDNALSS
jgi:hypothetical protein